MFKHFAKSKNISEYDTNYNSVMAFYSKVIDSDTLYSLVQYTKKTIEDRVQDIINADFNIDPKIYAGNNISCRFCTFQDICFHKEYDNIYLNKVDDLSFLGGEE